MTAITSLSLHYSPIKHSVHANYSHISNPMFWYFSLRALFHGQNTTAWPEGCRLLSLPVWLSSGGWLAALRVPVWACRSMVDGVFCGWQTTCSLFLSKTPALIRNKWRRTEDRWMENSLISVTAERTTYLYDCAFVTCNQNGVQHGYWWGLATLSVVPTVRWRHLNFIVLLI